jgi:hypothetical protein
LKIAVLIHACDRYELLYQGHQFFFQNSWPVAHPEFTYFFATEEIDFAPPGFINLKSGPGEWTDRLVRVLDQIEEDHVVYMQEDMWITRSVSAELILKARDFLIAHNSPLFKLHSSPVYVTNPTEHSWDGLNVGLVDNNKSEYLMSHQLSLWNKEFLKAQLPKGEHPWRNERRGTKRLKKANPRIFHLDLFSENGLPSINKNSDEAHRSEYFTVSVNACLNGYAGPLIKRLASSPELQAYAAKLEHHYTHQITHDGKPKPQKQDLLKRIKNSFIRLFG